MTLLPDSTTVWAALNWVPIFWLQTWSRYVRDCVLYFVFCILLEICVLQLPTLLPSVSTLVTRIAPKLVSSEVSPTWERRLILVIIYR